MDEMTQKARDHLPSQATHHSRPEEMQVRNTSVDALRLPAPRLSVWLLYILALLVGLLIRYWLWRDQGQAGMVYQGDPDEYYLGAIHLWLNGTYYDSGQWLRPPLTSAFFALLFTVFGPNLANALLVQCVLSTLTAIPIAMTARSIWRDERAGIVAAWATALYLPFAVQGSLLLSETIFICAVALAFLLFERARRQRMRSARTLFAGGVAFGLAALARPVGLYAAPLLAIWSYIECHGLRAAARATLFLGLGCMIIILPWAARNYYVYHQLVLVDTNGGVSFWLGTIDDPAEQHMQDVWKATLPNSALRQQAALRLGWQNIRNDPGRYLARMRNKAVSLWQPDTRLFASNAVTGITLAQRSLSFNIVADIEYIALMGCAILGIAIAGRNQRNWALLLWPLYGTLLSALTLGHPRLRLPLLVTALIYAAGPLVAPREILARLKARGWQGYMLCIAGGLIFSYLIFSTAYIPFIRSESYALRGDLASLQHAVKIEPEEYLAWSQLAQKLRATGDLAGAEAAYRRAVELNPRDVESRTALLRLLLAKGDTLAAGMIWKPVSTIGWDNNATYRWAWKHEPYAPEQRLDIGSIADIGAMHGFSAPFDEGGRSIRFTVTPQAAIRLSGRAATTLHLRFRSAYSTVPLQVALEGTNVFQTVATLAWQDIDIPLTAPISGPVVVQFEAPLHVGGVDAPYAYGIAVDQVELRP